VTGARALERLRAAERTLAEAAGVLKVPVAEVPQRLATVVRELKELKKAKPAAAAAGVTPETLLAAAVDVGGARVVVADMQGGDAGAMRQAIDQLRRKASPIAVLLGSVEGDKVTLVAGISKELEARGLSAGNWIRDVATVVGGKGGGRPDLAQAGGKLVAKLPEALETARQQIQTLLSG
jgi:alanyl-tRNA synthetase